MGMSNPIENLCYQQTNEEPLDEKNMFVNQNNCYSY